MILRSNRNFPFKKFPSLSQFCIVIDSIGYRYRVFRLIFNLRRYFSMKVFFFSRETKKQNSIRFQTNFTDYKYFLPAILSINRKIKKKKKEEAIYSSSKSRERKSKPTVFTITRSIYFSPLHSSLSPSPPPSFATRTISLPPCFLCILFYSTAPFLLPKIGFPATHFHKTESVLHPQIFIPRGEIARPF